LPLQKITVHVGATLSGLPLSQRFSLVYQKRSYPQFSTTEQCTWTTRCWTNDWSDTHQNGILRNLKAR